MQRSAMRENRAKPPRILAFGLMTGYKILSLSPKAEMRGLGEAPAFGA